MSLPVCEVCKKELGTKALTRVNPDGQAAGKLNICPICLARHLHEAEANAIADGATEVICRVLGFPTFTDGKTKFYPRI
jgi:hypothetical protein